MRKTLALLFYIFISFSAFAQADTTQKIVSGRRNSPDQQQKPYVILISADGFRYDYAEKYGAKNLLAFGRSGVRAKSMIPSFPSLTFPNHYTIVTGLYPSHHGLVDNNFYDPDRKDSYSMRNNQKVQDGTWYGGTPLWVLAEKQGMLAASFYWVGSEADIQGIRPTYYYNYNEEIDIDKRIQAVKDWLSLPGDRRPHLITFYLPEVDHAGHRYGPEAEETRKEVLFVDSALNALVNAVAGTGLPVNFIFVSDHGMTKVDTASTLPQPTVIDTSKFKVSGGGVLVQLFAKDKKDIRSQYLKLKKSQNGYRTYLKTNVPRRLHFGLEDDFHNRIGDILLIPDGPRVFNLNNRKTPIGWHGYDPTVVKDMDAVFFAWGPAFKNGIQIPAFKNVDVYPMITEILQLKTDEKIDGTGKTALRILKK